MQFFVDEVDESRLPQTRVWVSSVPRGLPQMTCLCFFLFLPPAFRLPETSRFQQPAPWWRLAGRERELHFPATLVRALGASAQGARSLQSARRPLEPLPRDEVGGARNHLATANRPMQHSLSPPASGSARGAQCSTEAALRWRLQRRGRRSTGRGWEGAARANRGAPDEGAGAAGPA